jgi:hypothetical protein
VVVYLDRNAEPVTPAGFRRNQPSLLAACVRTPHFRAHRWFEYRERIAGAMTGWEIG